MNRKGLRVRISAQNFGEILHECGHVLGPGSRKPAESRFSHWGELINGRIEMLELRPGMRIINSDYCLNREVEISSGVDQPTFSSLLTMEGGSIFRRKDDNGRTIEGCTGAGSHTVGTFLKRKYKLTLAGLGRHRSVRLDISTQLISNWFNNNETTIFGLDNSKMRWAKSGIQASYTKLSPILQSLARQIIHCPLQGSIRRIFLEGKAMEILAHELGDIYGAPPRVDVNSNPSDIERLQKARYILETEFVDPPGIFELARRVGLNDYKLKRGFRECFGTTIFGYVRDLKMQQAHYLLTSNGMSVSEVLMEVGYASPGNFAAAFKKRYGMLPSECRMGKTKYKN